MPVTLGITGAGVSATVTATNARAADILKRAAEELGLQMTSEEPGFTPPTNQEVADYIVDEWVGRLKHFARRNRKAEVVPPVEMEVDDDPNLDWKE